MFLKILAGFVDATIQSRSMEEQTALGTRFRAKRKHAARIQIVPVKMYTKQNATLNVIANTGKVRGCAPIIVG